MCLTSHICHIGSHHELIEHRGTALRQTEGHSDFELTFLVGDCLFVQQFLTLLTVVQRLCIPVTTVGPPPEGCTTYHLIADLSILKGHTGITQSGTFYSDGIASSIGLLHLWEVYMERRTLVFLNMNHQGLAVNLDAELARETFLR